MMKLSATLFFVAGIAFLAVGTFGGRVAFLALGAAFIAIGVTFLAAPNPKRD
jgi:predicted phage tail protein